jgi:hypothetical protein
MSAATGVGRPQLSAAVWGSARRCGERSSIMKIVDFVFKFGASMSLVGYI